MKNITALRRVGANIIGKVATGSGRSAIGKFTAGSAALMASGAALASGGSPGAAVAAELASGKSEMGLIFAAVAVLIGLLVVWMYTKRAAK
ncbi:hypothetical protein [Stenotrophomonas sp.]|uniref:hypothetical protein n=1 Tax=Stenotrophomonas sp. TaxID=69392 RepID=UPI0028A9D41D|nr:hypothetical protein [Stenotrophomonas sp.]